jgi:hypothetical protein
MTRYVSLAGFASFLVLFSALPVWAACPVIAGLRMPCAEGEPQPAVPARERGRLAPLRADAAPLFTHDQVAPDVTPEHLALLNDPTWERAVDAAIVSLYRNLRALEATYLMDAARRAMVKDIEARHDLSRKDIVRFLQVLARDWGLPTADLTGVAPPTLVPGADAADTARILSELMQQGQGAP